MMLLVALLAAQITLGAFTVLTARHYIVNSLHVVTGAGVLAVSLVLTLRTHRERLSTALFSATASAGSRTGMPREEAKAGAGA
jgi:hypothetical protein